MKIKIVSIFILLVCICFLYGCASEQPKGSSPNGVFQSSSSNTATRTNFVTVTVTNYVTEPARMEDLQTRNGLSLRDAQDKALKLEPGMTKEEIISLLGKPDETSAGTYGTQTAHPWNGITWYYRWGSFQDSHTNSAMEALFQSHSDKILSIILQRDSDAFWVVNSWQWSSL